MKPKVSARNLTPTSIAAGSPESMVCGVVAGPQIEQGQLMLTVTPAPGVSRFPLSSTARVLIVAGSPESMVCGVVAGPQIEQGQLMLTVTPAPGVSRFPLSSTARVLIVAVGLPCATHE